MRLLCRSGIVGFAITACLLIVSEGEAANILQNPGFETGDLSPWFQDETFQGTEDWNVTTADSFSGGFSATAVGDRGLRQDIPPTLGADITELSFWVRHPFGPLFTPVGIKFFIPSGSFLRIVDTQTHGWEFIDARVFLPDHDTLIAISIFGFHNSSEGENRTYLDDFRLNVVPEPTSLALLAGLGATCLRRRAG